MKNGNGNFASDPNEKIKIVLNPKSVEGGDAALAFLAEKAEKEGKPKEENNRLQRERLEKDQDKTEKFMQQHSDMLAAILEMQRQQSNLVQASQMISLQHQQQQGELLIALLSIVDKEN